MKKSLLLAGSILMLISCTKETPRSTLLEYEIKGQLYSYTGYAFRYTDYAGTVKKGYDWHLYNRGTYSFYLQAYDTTFEKIVFNYPSFQIELNVELPGGNSKTYRATSGQFRIVGTEMSDIVGDFRATVKNELNPKDSLVIANGYYRLYLEQRDRVFSR